MDKLSQTPSEPVNKKPPSSLPEKEKPPCPPVDPTRYKDWEKNGRCIDF